MIKGILCTLLAGILFGFALGSGLQEMWLLSLAFYSGSCFSLWLFVRTSLRRCI